MQLLRLPFLVLTMIFLCLRMMAQVGIGHGVVIPDSSAILDLVSTDKGMLLPRMSSANRLLIHHPANGLMVFDTTLNSLCYYSGTNWKCVEGAISEIQVNASVKGNVCIGDTMSFNVNNTVYDDFFWIMPTGDTLHFVDSVFVLQPNQLISGTYRGVLKYGSQEYYSLHHINVRECRIYPQNDFIIYKSNQLYDLTANDNDNNDYTIITHINGQKVIAGSAVLMEDDDDVIVMLNSDLKRVSVVPLTLKDKFYQFDYTVEDMSGFTSTGIVTAKVKGNNSYSVLNSVDFQAIVNNAQPGDTIDLQNKKVVVEGRPIDIDKPLTIRNGLFQRACTELSHLSVPSMPDTNFIVVDEPYKFNVGDWIIPLNSDVVDDNASGQILNINEISGDTLRINQNFINAMPAGAKVIKKFPMIRFLPDPNLNVTLENIIFDGNKGCNNYIYDWKYNTTLNVGLGMMVNNCTFINTPCENIFMCGGTVQNCRAYNLNGSFIHASCPPQENAVYSYVKNNYTKGVCQVPQVINGHNEGWFSYSANVVNFVITGNKSYDGGESSLGLQGIDDYNNVIENNIFKNFLHKRYGLDIDHPNPDNLLNNTFINVPD